MDSNTLKLSESSDGISESGEANSIKYYDTYNGRENIILDFPLFIEVV